MVVSHHLGTKVGNQACHKSSYPLSYLSSPTSTTFFKDRVSLCCPVHIENLYVDQVVLQLTKILLPLLPQCCFTFEYCGRVWSCVYHQDNSYLEGQGSVLSELPILQVSAGLDPEPCGVQQPERLQKGL